MPWRNDPNPPGDQVLTNGAWTLSGAGTGITSGAWQMYGYTDQFHYVYQAVANDQTIVAKFTGFGANPPAKAQAGIMVRASTSPTAPYYAILLSGAGGGQVQWRAHPNAVTRTGFIPMTSLAAPVYLRITRYSDKRFSPPVVTYDAATSTDGTTWTEVVGSTAAIDMGGGAAGPTLMGLAATANVQRTQVPAELHQRLHLTDHHRPPGRLSHWLDVRRRRQRARTRQPDRRQPRHHRAGVGRPLGRVRPVPLPVRADDR